MIVSNQNFNCFSAKSCCELMIFDDNVDRLGTSGQMGYWRKQLNDNYGLQGTAHLSFGRNYNSWMYKIRRSIVSTKLRRLISNMNNIEALDIGSGSGYYVDVWKQLGAKDVVGCDITSIFIKRFRTLYPRANFIKFDLSSNFIPLIKQFDYVTAFDILSYIQEDDKYAKAISNIYNLLKPGGLFIFSENFVQRKSHKNKFQSIRSLSEIQLLLQATGFEILERSPMFYLMNAPVDSDGVMIHRFWNSIKKIASNGETFGSLIGCALYPIELLLISISKESPSTEIMVCRKH